MVKIMVKTLCTNGMDLGVPIIFGNIHLCAQKIHDFLLDMQKPTGTQTTILKWWVPIIVGSQLCIALTLDFDRSSNLDSTHRHVKCTVVV